MIKTVGLTKTFGTVTAVDNLNLDIPRGEVFVFLGPNAAGKTTTIKLLTGLLKPTSGSVYIGGFDLTRQYLEAKRLISYVPDIPYLYDKLTGRELLKFVADLYEMPKALGKSRAQELLEKFGLIEYKDQLIEDYSHGTKKKLVMCAAFLHQPQVVIIDEPMVGLDPRSRRLVMDMLKESSQDGCTVFLSTHTLSVAEELADLIGIINRGRLVSIGTMEQLRQMSRTTGRLEEAFLQLTEEG